MGAYDFNFDVPPGLSYAPNPDRVRALAALLPPAPFSYAPPAADRAAWAPWAETVFGRKLLQSARELAVQPFPDYTDAAYLDCLAREDVTHINQVMTVVRKRQVAFLLAEAVHDRGEFLGVIGEDTRRLAALRTWIHPGNDLKRLNYDGKTVESDLAVMHTGANLAETDFLLGARLPAELRTLIRAEIDRRVLRPLKQRLESGRDLFWWIDVKHNWNSVCLACLAECAATMSPTPAERAWYLAFAEGLILNFRDGINDDGVCTEGVGYWSYGFMHFLMLAELLRVATGGAADLLDEPKMMRAVRFPDNAEIVPNVFPTFADCSLTPQPALWARVWPENRRGTVTQPVEPLPAGQDPLADLGLGMIAEPLMWMFRARDPHRAKRAALTPGRRNWFGASTLLIARPGPATRRRLAATLLGGNNGTNHNHNDLGTFTVILDGRTLVVDPGAEVYSFRTFSTHRYDSQLLNSYGHPVPRVAGRLQEAGPEYQTRVLAKEFTDDMDRVVLDLRFAYDVPTLRRLEREFAFDRRGDGSVSVTDRVEFSEPAAFESALITFAAVTFDGPRVRLTDGPATVVAEVTAEGAELEFATDTINQPPAPKRVALRCRGAVRAATIRTVFRPA